MMGTARSDRGSESKGAADLEIQPFVIPAQGRTRRDHGAHRGAAGEVDGNPGVLQGLDRADVAIGPRAAAGQDQADGRAGDDAGDAFGVRGHALDAVEPAVGLKRV